MFILNRNHTGRSLAKPKLLFNHDQGHFLYHIGYTKDGQQVWCDESFAWWFMTKLELPHNYQVPFKDKVIGFFDKYYSYTKYGAR